MTSEARIIRVKDPLALPSDQERAPLWSAELFFKGVYRNGPSFRAAVFLNRPSADHDTPEDDAHGYAGCFFVFGKGGCFGDEGHCDPRGPESRFDTRVFHGGDTTRSVDVTAAVRRELAAGKTEVAVTVVPRIADSAGVPVGGDTDNPVQFSEVELVTYDAYAPAAQRDN
jgi:tyrosinase